MIMMTNLFLEKLSSRHPSYASFIKLSIESTAKRVLLDPSFWPDGVAVRNFINGVLKSKANFTIQPTNQPVMT